MKVLYYLLLFITAYSCRKDSSNHSSNGNRLVAVSANGKIDETFEYKNDLLIKYSVLGCESIPWDKFEYIYKEGKIEKLIMTLGTGFGDARIQGYDGCDPHQKTILEEKFEYDNRGRLLSTFSQRESPVFWDYPKQWASKFRYNTKGQIEMEVNSFIINGIEQVYDSTLLFYDSEGNITQTIWKPLGGYESVINYEYDHSLLNPFHLIKQRRYNFREAVSVVSPFTVSPKYLVRRGNIIRKVLARKDSLPVRVLENSADYPIEDGVEYVYTYQ